MARLVRPLGPVRLEVAGPDRAKFLHNLTTNDVKRLAAGAGHEAFVTSPQGKTLGYVTLLADRPGSSLRTDPGSLERLLPHLQKYGVFDDVAIDDVSAPTFEFHLAGPAGRGRSRGRRGRAPGRGRPRPSRRPTSAACAVRIVRESPDRAGPA